MFLEPELDGGSGGKAGVDPRTEKVGGVPEFFRDLPRGWSTQTVGNKGNRKGQQEEAKRRKDPSEEKVHRVEGSGAAWRHSGG